MSHATYSGEGWVTLADGYSNVQGQGKNSLEIFFVSHVAALYLNDAFLGTVDISSVTVSGDVMAAYGILRDDDHGTALFENFTVWGSW